MNKDQIIRNSKLIILQTLCVVANVLVTVASWLHLGFEVAEKWLENKVQFIKES